MAGKKGTHSEAADEDLFGDDGDGQENEPEEIDDEPEPLAAGEEIDIEPRKTRKERNRSRFEDRIAQGVEQRLQSAIDARLANMENLLRQGQQQPGGQQPRGNPDAPTIEQIDRVIENKYQEKDLLTDAWSAKLKTNDMTAEERTAYIKKARKLDEEIQELATSKTLIRLGVNRNQGMDADAVRQETIRAQAQARHGDVFSHSKGKEMTQWAEGYYRQRMAEGGSDGQDLQDEAMDAARKRFGLQPRYTRNAQPSRETKARLGGASTSGGGGNGNGTARVKVTRSMIEMANAAFPHIKEERKRVEEWVRLNKEKGSL